jgi:acyl-CoA synthetase (AMP-forming)/AMP-acid ligase II
VDLPLGSLTSRIPRSPSQAVDAMTGAAAQVTTLVQAGIIAPIRPDKLARIAERYRRYGPTPAMGSAACAIRFPDEVGLIDELGSLTFSQMHERSNALARSLRDEGIGPDDGVAIMCRNHRGFADATIACSKLGANALYLNTSFAGPQLVDVLAREGPVALVYDEEFAGLLAEAAPGLRRFVAWRDQPGAEPSLEEMIASAPKGDLDPPAEDSRFVILTSGTTGTPKGASRPQPSGLSPFANLLAKIPMRTRQTTMIAAPLFHSWGFANFILGLPLAATVVLRRQFDPQETLAATAEHRARGLVVVPVMMQRILQLPPEKRQNHDLSSLEVTAVSGSAVPGELATRWMDTFGDNLYNLYGSTEVAWATIAMPRDMREAPGTAGRAPRGTVVKIYDPDGHPLPDGETGRIFVGNDMQFEGYTGGGAKDEIDGLMSSGDVGHFDRDGRLFIDGRDDEMIVSGGENVFPREVEELLSDHEAVDEAAAVGVEDEQFGQRLKAFVVLNGGAEASEDELKTYVKAHLARYKVPREIEFLDELPRNATGKVVKRELVGDRQGRSA